MKKLAGIGLFTVVEVAGLVGWLALANAGLVAAGIAVLAVALVVEHIITDNVLHNRSLINVRDLPLLEIAAFSGLETAIWAGWLLLWGVSPAMATAFLLLALLIEHTISRNVHERRDLLDRLVDPETLPHTIVEVVSCDLWLILARAGNPLAAVVLLIGSFIEHVIAVKVAQR